MLLAEKKRITGLIELRTQTSIATRFRRKIPKIYNGEKTSSSSIMVLGKLDS